MWFNILCTLIDNDILHHSGQNLLWTHAAVVNLLISLSQFSPPSLPIPTPSLQVPIPFPPSHLPFTLSTNYLTTTWHTYLPAHLPTKKKTLEFSVTSIEWLFSSPFTSTPNSTHMWHQHGELNPGQTGGRWLLSPLRNPYKPMKK